MRMHNPPHPGIVIGSLCLEPLGVNITESGRNSTYGAPIDRANASR